MGSDVASFSTDLIRAAYCSQKAACRSDSSRSFSELAWAEPHRMMSEPHRPQPSSALHWHLPGDIGNIRLFKVRSLEHWCQELAKIPLQHQPGAQPFPQPSSRGRI